ncbi:MAG: protease pro-enzyme activation domain-containing protein [Ignisphaera sp.]
MSNIMVFLLIISIISQITTVFYQNNQVLPVIIKGSAVEGELLPDDLIVTVTIAIPLKNINLLYYYASAVSDPNSPLYHKFLTQDEVKQLFYPTEKFNEVLNYLKTTPLKVVFTAADSIIVVQGTVSQVRQYLGLNYMKLNFNGKVYYTAYGESKLDGVFIYSSNVTSLFFSRPSTLVTRDLISQLSSETNQITNLTYPIEAYPPTYLQVAYNATPLLMRGINGSGYTIGILDFYGDPYIEQQLAYFDKIYNLPPPPKFSIENIGAVNPSAGLYEEWAIEISLDVEVAHAIAPGANIILYQADPNLPLAPVIAYIVDKNEVDVVSQSFGIPETYFSILPASFFYFNVMLTDEYYALGSVKGITFIASSGDAGGSGYSAGPLGTVIYPSSSPFVLSAGGTTTYITFMNGKPYSAYHTAWSNYGFIPDLVNFGGGGGGVSVIEPKPWYQWSISTPASYPNGNLNPTISANANVYPGIYIVVPGNKTDISGGTSESSPLLAGLFTLVMQYSKTRLGLLNPVIFEMAQNSTIYNKAFIPITFGYIIPWTSSYGYNLATGWGSINIGYFAYYYNLTKPKSLLTIKPLVNISAEVFPGDSIPVVVNVTYGGKVVSSGNFYAVLVTLQGNVSSVKLAYTNGSWIGSITVPSNAGGYAMVVVYGSYNGSKSYTVVGMTFIGYYMYFLSPLSPILMSYYLPMGISVIAEVTDLNDNIANVNLVKLNVYSYNITDNRYTSVGTINLLKLNISNFIVWVGRLKGEYPIGVILLKSENPYGFVSFFNGINMQGSYTVGLRIVSPVVAEPGAVFPGEDIVIFGTIEIPLNVENYLLSSGFVYEYFDMLYGSTITAKLLSPQGKVVSEAKILPNPDNPTRYLGFLKVPLNSTPGLYTILLFAFYNSSILNMSIRGYFYGQIYVSDNQIKVIPNFSAVYVYQGQKIQILADIRYPNNSVVKYGMFSATVYPQILSSQYSSISRVLEIPLWYDEALGKWVGNLTLPSTLGLGNLTYLTTGYYSLPLNVLVSGVTANGYSTNNSINNHNTVFITPYTYVSNIVVKSNYIPLEFMAFDRVTFLNINANLVNDVFDGINYINSSAVTISSSRINGVLYLYNTKATIVATSGNKIIAINSNITLVNSNLQNIVLIRSYLNNINSNIVNITPPPPKIVINSPANNANITTLPVQISFTVTGSNVVSNYVYLNGVLLQSFTGNGTFTLTISNLTDGTYRITVVSVQSTGVSSKAESTFLVNAGEASLSSSVKSLGNSLSQTSSLLDSKISSVNTNSYIGIGIGVVALIISIIALIIRRR